MALGVRGALGGGGGAGGGHGGANRIYVGSVFYELQAEQLKAVFEAFGKIKSCELIPVRTAARARARCVCMFVWMRSCVPLCACMLHEVELCACCMRTESRRRPQGLRVHRVRD